MNNLLRIVNSIRDQATRYMDDANAIEVSPTSVDVKQRNRNTIAQRFVDFTVPQLLSTETSNMIAEDQFDYQAEAVLTCSPKWYGANINGDELLTAIARAVVALETLDAVKKALFYGRFEKLPANLKAHTGIEGIGNTYPQSDIDVFHALLGVATEAGEMLELLAGFLTGTPFDPVHVNEEFGDAQWYIATGLKALDMTILQSQKVNINKLRARFPNKFTEYDANNRDLTNERRILEEKPTNGG